MNDVAERQNRPWALVAAVAVVLGAVLVVVLFGLRPYPDLPTVAEQPDPPVSGRLAHITYGGDGPCLHVVEGTGESRQLGCGSDYEGFDLRWVDADRLALGAPGHPGDGQTLLIDAATGEILERVPDATISGGSGDPRVHPTVDRATSPQGEEARTGRQDDRTWVEVDPVTGETRRILELEGPERYDLFDPVWTANGRWIVVRDSIGRVIVMAADGAGSARIWADADGGETAVR